MRGRPLHKAKNTKRRKKKKEGKKWNHGSSERTNTRRHVNPIRLGTNRYKHTQGVIFIDLGLVLERSTSI